MISSIAVIKFLQQLLKRTYRQDKSFDDYQLRFIKRLQSATSSEAIITILEEGYKKLKILPNNLEDTLSEGRLITTQSQLQLQRSETLSATIKNRIKEMQQADAPYSVTEHYAELMRLIKIYQRAVIELNKHKTIRSTDHTEAKLINDELQQLLIELNIDEDRSSQLEVIRLAISNTVDPLALPQHCLSIISIIIDSTREERRASRQFLYTLNDNLTQFYLNLSHTAQIAKNEFKQQDDLLASIQQQTLQLKNNADNADSLESLRHYVIESVNNVQQVIETAEHKQKHKFRHKFQNMVRQIKELQDETQGYQKILKQQSKQLNIDFLTKIPNRAAWSERLEIEISRFKRYKTPLFIAIIDIDAFKMINDTYGHLAGDKVLNTIAQALQKSIRTTDYIARFGGEEFTLLLTNVSHQQAQEVLNKLCQQISSLPFQFKQESVTVTISIGFTEFMAEDESDQAFNRADKALYEAKRNGRNQVNHLNHL